VTNAADLWPCPVQGHVTIFPGMFCVTKTEATAIRTAYEQGGEFSAAIELRRLFPGITDNAKARECAQAIAGWRPVPTTKVTRLHPDKDWSLSLPPGSS